jgi:hypothetical protein
MTDLEKAQEKVIRLYEAKDSIEVQLIAARTELMQVRQAEQQGVVKEAKKESKEAKDA